ncbi:MAG: hypothetical protein ACKVKF_23540, partial [Rhodobacterales bacterium]
MPKFTRSCQKGEVFQTFHNVTYKRAAPNALQKWQGSELAIKNAALRIRRIDDVLSHMLAAQQLREEGGASNLEQAKRIERLCQVHPRFGMSAKRML